MSEYFVKRRPGKQDNPWGVYKKVGGQNIMYAKGRTRNDAQSQADLWNDLDNETDSRVLQAYGEC